MVKGHKKRDKCNLAGGKLAKLTMTCPKMRGMSW